MSSKKNKFFADNISIEEILKSFLKEKIIIISISLSFSIFFGLLYYYSGINHIKKNQNFAVVKVSFVKEEFYNLYSYYENLEPNNIYSSIQNKLDLKNLKFEILNSNFVYFFEQNKEKFGDFKDYFEKSNISVQDYFSKNFRQEGNDYYLNYPKQLQGEFLIKEFIFYEINRHEIKEKKELRKNIQAHIDFVEKIKKIKNKKNFENNELEKEKHYYIIDWNIFSNKYLNIVNLDYTIFFSKEIIKDLDNNNLNYPFPHDLQTNVTTIKNKYPLNSVKNFVFIGLIFGFFLSLIIVFIKNLIRKDNL